MLDNFIKSSAVFIENRGQWPDEMIRFALSSHGVNVGLTGEGPRFQLFQREPRAGVAALWRAPQTSPKSAGRPTDGLASTGSLNPPQERSGGHQFAATRTKQFSARFVGTRQVTPVGKSQAQQVFHYRRGEPGRWCENVRS
ncbi:MAG: hypothetical protein HYY24_23915 [Verrucomicrobia bacterium]|nr:hypothetical protein [Verrucomicrobiota bacterium]